MQIQLFLRNVQAYAENDCERPKKETHVGIRYMGGFMKVISKGRNRYGWSYDEDKLFVF